MEATLDNENFETTQEKTNQESDRTLTTVSKGIVIGCATLGLVAFGAAVYFNFVMAPFAAALVYSFVDLMTISFLGVLGTGCLVVSYEAIAELF